MIPLALKDKMKSGFIAGIINGFCYLGSTVSTYGLGLIADNYSWITVFYVLCGTCAAAAVAGIVYTLITRLNRKMRRAKG